MSTTIPDDVRWFHQLGTCQSCGKQATGTLKGSHNQSLGASCKRCAEKRIAQAAKARANLEKIRAE